MEMTRSRMRTIFKIIALAMEMGKGDIVKQIVAYGVHWKITETEAKFVLSRSLTGIYNDIHDLKPPTVVIPEPMEAGPQRESLPNVEI